MERNQTDLDAAWQRAAECALLVSITEALMQGLTVPEWLLTTAAHRLHEEPALKAVMEASVLCEEADQRANEPIQDEETGAQVMTLLTACADDLAIAVSEHIYGPFAEAK